MNRLPVITCLAAIMGCSREAADREIARPLLMDVSADDCAVSVLVYDQPPVGGNPSRDLGTPFINDGCWGKRIFLGIDGERRAEELPLGLGGAYSDGEYRVLVKRGRTLSRVEFTDESEIFCEPPQGRKYSVAYEMKVRMWSAHNSWIIDGGTYDEECGS
jgi:hypothetical protein